MKPNIKEIYFDKDGRPTLEGYKLLAELERRISTLENQIADHEERLVVLEP